MCSLDDTVNLSASLRPRLVTLGRCHSTQERVANVPASWEDQGRAELPLPSCAIAVHSIPTTASTNVDYVVNGNLQFHVPRQRKVCKMEELDESFVWREAAAQGSIKTLLEAH